ncbi:39S ribosomal protein L43, mitochondrial [Desmophyllum pertusum]|uniref:Large ribosomal subunit protein mL43 n=1 Tax=Desmophyllum pertusum TaxID=174260 RepID=A0A9X0A2A5_9CNID|nr:39S ribosomal protein L43, mitochondrial [Desmophyllum pertusum]
MAQVNIANRVFGRYVRPLQRLTLNYCKNGGSSRGMREFIDKNIVDFAKSNPGVAIYVRERNGKHPRLVANFINGNTKVVHVKNMSPEKVQGWVTNLRNESGEEVEKIKKYWHTENPSIQGTWNPFLHKPPAMRKHVANKIE